MNKYLTSYLLYVSENDVQFVLFLILSSLALDVHFMFMFKALGLSISPALRALYLVAFSARESYA